MKKVLVRGSTLVILAYICFTAFFLSAIIEWLKGNEFDTFYLIPVYMGVILWLLGKWKVKRDKQMLK